MNALAIYLEHHGDQLAGHAAQRANGYHATRPGLLGLPHPSAHLPPSGVWGPGRFALSGLVHSPIQARARGARNEARASFGEGEQVKHRLRSDALVRFSTEAVCALLNATLALRAAMKRRRREGRKSQDGERYLAQVRDLRRELVRRCRERRQ